MVENTMCYIVEVIKQHMWAYISLYRYDFSRKTQLRRAPIVILIGVWIKFKLPFFFGADVFLLFYILGSAANAE